MSERIDGHGDPMYLGLLAIAEIQRARKEVERGRMLLFVRTKDASGDVNSPSVPHCVVDDEEEASSAVKEAPRQPSATGERVVEELWSLVDAEGPRIVWQRHDDNSLDVRFSRNLA